MTPEQWKLFLKQTKRDDGPGVADESMRCLIWTGPGFGEKGYGLSKEHKKLAHLVAFEHYSGRKITKGHIVAQSCSKKRCVAEAHLAEEYVGRV